MMIDVKNIKKSFGANEVLRGVSFSVDKGEIISVIGPSGSGKSTMLRSLIGSKRSTRAAFRSTGKRSSKTVNMSRKGSRGEFFPRQEWFSNISISSHT